MRYKDPYGHQRAKKSESRQKILRQIETEPSTFGEIETKVGLSVPTLTEHLRKLENEGVITRQLKGRRREFVLTVKGKSQEQIRREAFAKSFDVIGKLARDNSSAKSLLDLAEFAKSEPKFFDEFMQWMKDYMTLVTSEDTLQWLNRHGDSSGRLLQAEIMKKLKPLLKGKPESGGELKELISDYQNLLNAMREIVSEKGASHIKESSS